LFCFQIRMLWKCIVKKFFCLFKISDIYIINRCEWFLLMSSFTKWLSTVFLVNSLLTWIELSSATVLIWSLFSNPNCYFHCNYFNIMSSICQITYCDVNSQWFWTISNTYLTLLFYLITHGYIFYLIATFWIWIFS